MAADGAERPPADIQALREEFPEFAFGTVWASAASGLGSRRVRAMREGLVFSAWTAEELALDIMRRTGRARA
jgi:hypothetical protein